MKNNVVKWNESSFLDDIEKRFNSQYRRLAVDLIEWAKRWANEIRFGETQKANVFPYLNYSDKNTCPFSIYTTGSVQIQFKRLHKLKAFMDRSKRLQLLGMLNQIDGVKISEDVIDSGKTPIRLELLLKPESLSKFKHAIEWVIETIKETPISADVLKEQYEAEQKEAKILSESELLKKIRNINPIPLFREVLSRQAKRSGYISEYAKRRANGICQLCENNAPFFNQDGKPYLETHHIEWLSRGGTDSIDNVVALCPNCHSKIHILDLDDDKEYLRRKVSVK